MDSRLQIKDINSTNEATTLVKSEKELVNHETGEVISRENIKVTKEKNREKFIKVFIDNLDYIIEALKPIEKGIFFVLMHQMNYHNIINLSSTIRKTAQVALNLSQPAVSKGINALIEKRVLLKIEKEDAEKFHIAFYTGKEYLVNPQLIGSGSFKELSKIRRVITTTFDFDTFNATKEIDTSYAYSDYNEVKNNLGQHEVKQINQIVSKDGKHSETEIVIGEKDGYVNKSNVVIDIVPDEVVEPQPNKKDDEPNSFSGIELEEDKENEPNLDDSKAYDIQMMIERRKMVEVENKKLELQIELKKLELQNK